jgi:hypothetical protein
LHNSALTCSSSSHSTAETSARRQRRRGVGSSSSSGTATRWRRVQSIRHEDQRSSDNQHDVGRHTPGHFVDSIVIRLLSSVDRSSTHRSSKPDVSACCLSIARQRRPVVGRLPVRDGPMRGLCSADVTSPAVGQADAAAAAAAAAAFDACCCRREVGKR